MKRIAFILVTVLALISVPAFAAEQLTPQQLASLVASAKTSVEHTRIATYYRTQADKLLVESNDHARMAATFRANPVANNEKRASATVNHCEYLARSLKEKSQKLRALAEEHEGMAQAAQNPFLP
jgi:hypothetical protein